MPDTKSGLSKFDGVANNNKTVPLTSEEMLNPTQEVKQSGLDAFEGTVPAIKNPASTNARQFDFNASAPEFKGVSNPNVNLTKTQQLNALSQSKWDQAGNAVAQFAANFGAGIADGIAQWDLKGTVNMLSGAEQEYGNMFHTIAQNLRETANDHRIYEYDPGGVSPGDFSWWANQFGQMGFSAGLFAEAIGEQALLASVTGGAGNIAALEKLGLSLAQRTLLKNASFGAVKGLQEGFINGMYTFDETKQKFMDNGYSEDEANRYAAAAASDAYKKEAVLGSLLNALTFSTLSYNPSTRQTIGLFDNLIKNKALSKGANLLTTMASEGFQEGWQNIVSNEGKYTADRMAGLVPERTLGQRLSNYMSDSGMWNEIIGGAFGGAFFHGIETIKDKVAGNRYEAMRDANYQEYKDGQSAMITDYVNQIGLLRQNGLTEQARVKQQELAYNLALSSHHLDRINGVDKDGAFDNYVGTLQGMINSVNSNDQEALAANGVTTQEQKDQILQTYPSFIEDAQKMKEYYNKEADFVQPDLVAPIAYREFLKNKYQSEIAADETSLINLQGSFSDYNELSDIGKQVYDNQLTSESIDNTIRQLEVENARTPDPSKAELLNTLKTQKKIVDDATAKLNEVSEERTQEQVNADNEILDSISKGNEYARMVNKITANKAELNLLRKELKTWRNSKFQNKVLNEGLLSKIREAKSLEDLQAIEDLLQGNEKQTREVKQTIKNRRNDLETLANNERNKERTKQQQEALAEQQRQNAATESTPVTNPIQSEELPLQTTPTTSAEFFNNVDLGDPNANPLIPSANVDLQPMAEEDLDAMASRVFGTELDAMDETALAESIQNTESTTETLSEKKESTVERLKKMGFITPLPQQYTTRSLETPQVVAQGLVNQEMIEDMRQLVKKISDLTGIAVPSIQDVHNAMEDVYQLDGNVKPYMEKLYDAWKQTALKKAGMDMYSSWIARESAPVNSDQVTMGAAETAVTNEIVTQDFGDNANVEDRPIYYIGNKIAVPDLKLAFNNLAYETLESETPDGIAVYNRTVNLDNLRSKDILDYNKFKVGSVLRLQLNPNLPATIWEDGKRRVVQFKDLNLQPDDTEYWMKVPMQVTDNAGNVLDGVFIHDPEWYNETNVAATENQADIIAEGQALVRSLRMAYANSGRPVYQIEITGRTEGTKEFIDTPFDELPSLNENNPDSLIGFATEAEAKDVRIGNGKTILNDRILGIDNIVKGSPVELRKVAEDAQGPIYLAMYPIRGTYSSQTASKGLQDALQSARRAYISYLLLNSPNLPVFTNIMTTQEAKDIAKEMTDSYGLSLSDPASINRYLNMLFYIRNEAPSEEFVRKQQPGSVVGFFNKGVFTIVKNAEDESGRLIQYDKTSPMDLLRNMQFLQPNLSNIKATETFAQKFPMIGVDNKVLPYVSPVNGQSNYHSFLKDTLKTNIKSWNIGTTENPNYITTVQPVITIASKGAVDNRSIAEIPVEEQIRSEVIAAEVEDNSTGNLITNLDEILANDFGRISVRGVDFNTFDVVIDRSTKTAEVGNVQKADPTKNKGVGLQAYIELGNRLKEAGITLVSDSSNAKNQAGVNLWNNLVAQGYATGSNSKGYRFTGKVETDIQARISDTVLSTISLLQNLGLRSKTNNSLSTPTLSNESVRRLIGTLNSIDGLSTSEIKDAQSTMMATIFTNLNNKYGSSFTRAEYNRQVEIKFEDLYGETLNLLNEKLNEIADLLAQVQDGNLARIYNEVDLHVNKFVALSDNWDTILSDVRTEVEKFVDFKEVVIDDSEVAQQNDNAFAQNENLDNTEVQDSDITEVQKDNPENWDKDGFQENYKNSVSLFVRRGLFTIPEYAEDGDFRRGAFGNKQYRRFEDNYNILMSLIAGNNKFLSDTKDLVNYLSDKNAVPQTYHKLAEETVKLINNNPQFDAALQYALTKGNTQLKMVVEQTNNKTGVTSMKVWDVNSNEVVQTITSQWREMNKQSPLIEKVEDSFKINPEVRQKLIDTFNHWVANRGSLNMNGEQFQNQLRGWFNDMGILMNPMAIRDLINSGYFAKEEGNSKQIKGVELISNSKGVINIFGKFLENTKRNTDEDAQDITENVSMNIFDAESNMIKNLARINQKYMGFVPTQSFRDAGKQLYGFENFMMDKYITNRLKYDPAFREQMSRTIFKGDSYILKALIESPEVLDAFDLVSSAITSIKMYGKDNYGNFEVKDLSEADMERFSLGLFTNQAGELTYSQDGIPMRMSTVLSLVSSDKKRRNINKVPVLNLDNTFFDTEAGIIGEGVEAQKLRTFLFDKMVMPELKRMIKHMQQARLNSGANTLVNQKDYNYGAQLFLLIPGLNDVKMGDTNQSVISYLQNENSELNETHIVNAIRDNAIQIVVNYINSEAQNKRENWIKFLHNSPALDRNGKYKAGQTIYKLETDQGTIDYTSVGHIDDKYASKFGNDKQVQLKSLALDYTINTLLTNLNNYQLYLGDVANFAQDKFFKVKKGTNAFFEVVDGKVDLGSPKYEGAYIDLIQNYIGVNLGKRAAMLIAPGSTLANSANESYIQVFANDANRVSEDTVGLVRLFYGETAANKEEVHFNMYKEYVQELADLQQRDNLTAEESQQMTALKNSISDLISGWMNDYPALAGYFDIESTDAQEYVTWKEHLRIIEGQGRISPEQYSRISEALTNGRDLTKEDLKFVFQPIKPVFAGEVTEAFGEDGQLRARQVYIKSSAFPLIPQFTKGKQLEGLRLKMEELEAKSGRNVRLSYGTANKVGAVSQPITIWDEAGRFVQNSFGNIDQMIEESRDNKSRSALVLPRQYFRIQQDVPFKSAKNNYDKITLGTQLMKIAFSNEVKELLNAKYGNDDVFNNYQNAFINWEQQIQEDLYDKLGYDNEGNIIDKAYTITKLRDMLATEAKQRNYPQQDVDILTNLLSNMEFESPLWLSANGYRYEAFINALLNNRFSKLKLPGAAFVVGSEEGFSMSPTQAMAQGKIVHTAAYDGTLKPNQAFVPSKFRDNRGNIIDLTSPEYSHMDENGVRRLNETKFDPELLKLISFRIPTSGHVSGSQVEIAGFLPYATGDLAIYGKDMTKQKGLDFDVDKENTYWLHHFVDVDGNLRRLTQETVDENVKLFEQFKGERNNLPTLINNPKILNKFLGDIFGKNPEDIEITQEEDMKALAKTLRKGLEIQLHQNTIIDSYHEIFGSEDPAIQRKIRRVLSTDFAEEQAAMISQIVNRVDNSKSFSLLSSDYQNNKMELGAVGKMGIGVYANYVTFHALSQQLASPLFIEEIVVDEKGNAVDTITPNFVIGNLTSNGRIGNVDSLKPEGVKDEVWNKYKRSISEIFDERANTATDNEKLQIMGVVGINAYTINLDSFLSLLGFDKDVFYKDGKEIVVNIPYFIMSQPIIKDYVNEIKNSSSQIAEFDMNKKQNIINQLVEKYGGTEVRDQIEDTDSRELTGRNLYDNLNLDRTNLSTQAMFNANKFQQIALSTFIRMGDLAEKIQQMQSHLNIQKEGLGKSFFDAESKIENLIKLSNGDNYSTPSYVFQGVSGFVGEFSPTNTESGIELLPQTEDQEGLYFTPTTPTGAIMKGLIKSYEELFKQFFPQDSLLFNDVIKTIMNGMGADNKSTSKKIELKHDIVNNMKKFLLSNWNGLYGNAQHERFRLLFDRPGHKSLATYIMDMKYSEQYAPIVAGNSLLSQFDFTLNEGNEPSLIVYRNSRGEDIQEDFKYQALIDLLATNPDLPNFNGVAYTAQDLVTDLVNYSYSIGGIQEANEFVKYIPLSMMREFGITDRMREIHSMLKENAIEGVLRPFIQQYFQHNPGRAMKFAAEALDNFNNKEFNSNTKTLTFKAELEPDTLPRYISVYNQANKGKGKRKNQLYKLKMLGETDYIYERLPLLGTSGMVEYTLNEGGGNIQPLIDRNTRYAGDPLYKEDARLLPEKMTTTQVKNMFDINTGKLDAVLKSIAESNSVSDPTREMVAALRPYMNDQTQIVVGSYPEAKGKYFIDTNTIGIDINTLNNDSAEEVALTILKEYLHSITFDELNKYYNYDSQTRESSLKPGIELPKHISQLNTLFNHVNREMQKNPEFNDMVNSMRVTGGLSTESQFATYGALNVFEFVSEIFGNKQFQESLSKIKYPNTNESLMDRFKKIINQFLTSLGLDMSPGTALYQGLNNVFDLLNGKPEAVEIEDTNPMQGLVNPVDQMRMLDNIDLDMQGEVETLLTPKFNETVITAAEIFTNNPGLQSVGTLSEYSKYLSRQTILYHGSASTNINKFDDKFLMTGEGGMAFSKGHYFTDSKSEADVYSRRAFLYNEDKVVKFLGLPLNTVYTNMTLLSQGEELSERDLNSLNVASKVLDEEFFKLIKSYQEAKDKDVTEGKYKKVTSALKKLYSLVFSKKPSKVNVEADEIAREIISRLDNTKASGNIDVENLENLISYVRDLTASRTKVYGVAINKDLRLLDWESEYLPERDQIIEDILEASPNNRIINDISYRKAVKEGKVPFIEGVEKVSLEEAKQAVRDKLNSTKTNGELYEEAEYLTGKDNDFGTSTQEIFKKFGYEGVSHATMLFGANHIVVWDANNTTVLGSNDDVQKFSDWKESGQLAGTMEYSDFSKADKAYLKANGVSEADYLTLTEQEKQHFIYQLKQKC